MNALNNPFDPSTPFFDVWPDYNLPEPEEERLEVQRQADLYTRLHYRDGNVKSSRRHQRKNKIMANRKARG